LRVAGPHGPVAGAFAGLADDGALLLLTETSSIVRIDAGDVLLPVA
jgi:hypothetical protein